MTPETAELQRRVACLITVGRVSSVDHANARAVVTFDGMTSAPLPWIAGRSGNVSEWSPPAVGEQVVICAPSGEMGLGFIMPGGIPYSGKPAVGDAANLYRLVLPAGGSWEIEVDSSKLTLTDDTFRAEIGGKTLEITGGSMTFDGNVNITGYVSVTGTVAATGDVTADTVSLKNHVHAGVEAGGSSTAPPTP